MFSKRIFQVIFLFNLKLNLCINFHTTGIFYSNINQNTLIIYCHKIYPLKFSIKIPSYCPSHRIFLRGKGFCPKIGLILLVISIDLSILSQVQHAVLSIFAILSVFFFSYPPKEAILLQILFLFCYSP